MPNKDIKKDMLFEHRRYIRKTKILTPMQIKHGDVITFSYNNELKTVLVLEPKLKGMLHGLSLNAIPRKRFIPLLLSLPEIPSKLFYESKLKTGPDHNFHAYRTYFVNKIGTIHKIEYTI